MLNRNSIVLYVAIFIISLGLSSCSYREENLNPKHIGLDAKFKGYDSLENMEIDSSLIVKAVKVDEDEPTIVMADGLMVSCYTISNLEISKVYKDNTTEYTSKDTIRILENEAYNKYDNTIYHVAGYEKMKLGDEYLLFLRKSNTDDWYIPVGIVFGKVDLGDDKAARYLNANEQEIIDYSVIDQINEDARAKYQ